ncbi:MAG TPA: Gfo/Idh/MocA family oxidoreductase [Terracidiphilus sp.]|nr:Gfo/Idh/MocA family oxidoreductase [Terracidiphilus sp.]
MLVSLPRFARHSSRVWLRFFSLGLLLALPCLLSAQAPLRVAVVGLEHGHVDGFFRSLPRHANVQLVGVADNDPALFAKYRAKYNLSESLFFKSTANMIEVRRPQAVLVYTSIGEHRHVIEIAAQYGVSVMVEKPLTLSLDDALAIRRTARFHHIHVLVNYETTWYPSNRAIYDELQRGRLGPLRRVVVQDGHQGPKEIGVPPEFFDWLTDPAQSGAGALYDFGCYGVDLTTWLMHGETPLTVTAVVNHDKPEIYSNVDDDSTIILAYPHAQAVIEGSWNWPFSRKDMEVYGATGYTIAVGADKLRLRLQHDSEERLITPAPLNPPENDPLNYLDAVLTGRILPKGDLSALDTNIVVMQILDAARQSARTGRTIHLTKLPD